jgi:hypothetical protein
MSYLVREAFRKIDYIIPLFDTKAWSGWTNQPDGGAVKVSSNSASDTGKLTIFGTIKTTGAFAYETVTLTGASVVTTTETDWDDIKGLFMGDVYGKNITAAVGTITLTNAAGSTITTIATTKLSGGLVGLDLRGHDVTVIQVSGNLYLYDGGAATTANGYPFGTAEKFEFIPIGDLFTLISDGSAATSKIVVYKS